MRNLLLQIAGALAEEGKSLGEISEFMRRNVLRCQFIFRSEHDKLVSRKKVTFSRTTSSSRMATLGLALSSCAPPERRAPLFQLTGMRQLKALFYMYWWNIFFAFSKTGRWRSAWASTARPGSGKIVVYSDKKNRATNAKMSMSGNSGG